MRRTGLAAAAVALALAAPAAASASTFFVASGGSDLAANPCTSASAPCLTIGAAVTRAEAAPDTATISVGPGLFNEDVALTHASDGGTTLTGSGSGAGGTTIQGINGNPTIGISSNSGVTLSNLHVLNAAGDTSDGVQASAAVTASNLAIDMQTGGGGVGFNASGLAPASFTGGSVTMASGGNGGAVNSSIGGISVTNTTIAQNGTGPGINAPFGAALRNVSLTMGNSGSASVAIAVIPQGGTVDGVTVGGSWTGAGLQAGGTTVVRDSSFSTPASSSSPGIVAIDASALTHRLVLQRVIVASHGSGAIGVLGQDMDVVVDSSELLGGHYALALTHNSGKLRTATVISSVLDAATLGARDGSANGVIAVAGGAGDAIDVEVEGSLAMEPASTTVSGGATTTINCAYSDVSSQTQAATASVGAINCASGAGGNVQTDPLTALFVNAPGGDYHPVAGSPSIDAVPESAITPPAGYTPSATDLDGNPRVVDGNGDCVAVRDRGPYELAGHVGVVPGPMISGPGEAVVGTPVTFTGSPGGVPSAGMTWAFSDGATATGATVTHAFSSPGTASVTLTANAGGSCVASVSRAITVIGAGRLLHLGLKPASLLAAPSGASITTEARRKAYGTTVTYSDTQAETAVFAVQKPRAGRLVKGSCVAPAKRNRRARACTTYTNVGGFSHTDTAGPNSFHFTGRVGGRALARGQYRLEGVPQVAGQTGPPVDATFSIR